MSTITTRAGKGSPLTNAEVDLNFTSLNTDKAELSGAAFTGAITTTSTVDGRDVATDGSKLDGIEAGATADQTAAEIKTAYESNADTNAFTDADESKLDGIEASADVTDTTNVTAAGALMDSELTAIASVKALNQGVATTDSPTFAGLTSTGEITANGGIALGDGDVATFGDSDDLSIFHAGGTTYLTNTTGSLVLRTDSFRVLNTANSEQILHGDANGAVTAYYDNSVKLATTSTGIDVTGNLTMASGGSIVAGGVNDLILNAGESGTPDIYLQSGSSTKVKIEGSNGNVGIGTTNPDTSLHVTTPSGTKTELNLAQTAVTNYRLSIPASTDALTFVYGANTERMRIDSSGRVGIGTSSPSQKLHVYESSTGSQAYVTVQNNRSRNAAVLTQTTNGGFYTGTSIGTDTLCWQVYDASAGERMRIDGSGNITQTGSSSADFLIKAPTDNASLTLQAGASDTGAEGAFVNFLQNTTYKWQMGMNTDNSFRWYNYATSSEAMRIDSSGNLLVGKTTTAIGTQGIRLEGNNGKIEATRSGNVVTAFNRTGSDGTISEWMKDGTAVGSIGTNVGRLSIGSGDTGVLFAGDIDAIYPANGIAARDSAIDLGVSGARFKDLYLSGGVYLGGTNAWNKLDDYEEGTWTPTLSGAVVTIALGKYTKVGNLVQFQARLDWSSGGGTHQVGGLPFTVPAGSGQHHSMSVVPYVNSGFGSIPTGKGWIVGYCDSGTTNITFTWQPNSSSAGTAASGQIYIEGTYQV